MKRDRAEELLRKDIFGLIIPTEYTNKENKGRTGKSALQAIFELVLKCSVGWRQNGVEQSRTKAELTSVPCEQALKRRLILQAPAPTRRRGGGGGIRMSKRQND